MNKLSKVLLIISIIFVIGFCVMLGLYFNLKKDYNELKGDFLFSRNGNEIENSHLDGNFLFYEEGK